MKIEKKEIEAILRDDLPGRFNEYNIIEKEYPRIFDVYGNGILPPYEVLIHPASTCNLKCLWCIGQNVKNNVDEGLPNNLFAEENMMKIIKDILNYKKVGKIKIGDQIVEREFKVENISFSGIVGEPFVNKKSLLQAIDYINRHGRRAGVFTNGVLMDESTYEILKDAGYVLVSVDAAKNETYAMMKYNGEKSEVNCLTHVLENIKNLVQYRDKHNGKVDVNAGFVVNQYNYDEIYELAKVLKEAGVHYLRLKTDIASIMNLTPEKLQIAKSQIDRVQNELTNHRDFQLVCIHRLGQSIDKQRNFDICRVNRLFAAVGSDGCLYACNYHPSKNGLKFGDLLKDNFQTVWENHERSINCKEQCPKMCDPFKNRANNLLDVIASLNGYQ